MKLYCTAIALFTVMLSTAQKAWEPYLQQYAVAQTSQAKMQALDSVLALSFRKDPDVFIKHSFVFIDLAEQEKDYEAMAKKAMNLSYPLNSSNRPEEGIAVIDRVLKYHDQIENTFLKGGLYLKRGGSYFRVDQKKAVEDYTMAIENFGPKDSIYVADAYLFRGQANTNLGDFVNASADYDIASRYFENLGDYQYMLFAKQGNITMFSMNGFLETAQLERAELIAQIKELGLYSNLSNEHYNQAVDDRKIGDFASAQTELLQAVKYLDSSQNKISSYFAIHGLLATQYAERGNLEKAEFHLGLLEDLRKKNPTDLITESHYHSTKTTILKFKGQLGEALKFAEMRLEDAKALGNQEQIINALQDLFEIHEAMGNIPVSLDYHKRYHRKKDSLFDSQKTNLMLYYQNLYESEKKEREIQTQTANIELLEKDNLAFKRWLVFTGIAGVLICGIVYLVFMQRGLKDKQDLQHKFSQKLLLSQEQERKRISKELHDGLGQNLLLIKNSLTMAGDDKNKKMVGEAIDEVRAISQALHPFQLQELGLTKAIENMVVQIDRNSTLFISAEIDNIDQFFNKEDSLNIYRIIQESFNNVLKHSEAEATKIMIKKDDDQVKISIQDNGKGFNVPEKFRDLKCMGLKTLKERVRSLKGVLRINSKTESGTELQFTLPV
ncbi:sensor histidine kinase [Gilvibacter sediminis]|uniref:sensor histidine kinase n=1 Tax=Gilvibacter sediminis TaxID=379071 RepID=UPI0023509CF2|nr:sensor histidine kinase [Gilvibacter sediminis]MDC7996487.1 sensor histidine kinase [Gilvibacter sediminis]